MSTADAIAERINRTANSIDSYLARRIRADAAEEAENERQWLRDCAEACRELQERYDSAFAPFSRKAPQPEADANPRSYRCDLFKVGQSMLPSGHELTKQSRDEMEGLSHNAFSNLERLLLAALAKEAEEPSGDNVPDDVADPRAKRERTDAMGGKFVEYHAKRSFIADLGRRGMRVAAIHGKEGEIIYPLRLREALAFR
jgi:hypothetical protein